VIIVGSILVLRAVLAGCSARRIVTWAATLGLLFLAFLAFNQGSRLIAYDASGFDGGAMFQINRDHLLFRVCGERIGESVAVTLSYASVGYFGLSYCFDLPFVWTWGIGNSFALMGYAEQYLGVADVILETYPLRAKAATGWPSMMYWETIFPWLASDLSYPGVALFFGLLGWFYATIWKECLSFRNPLSIAVLGYVHIMLFFSPCNNQLFQTRESTLGCLGVLCAWLLFHRRFNGWPAAAARHGARPGRALSVARWPRPSAPALGPSDGQPFPRPCPPAQPTHRLAPGRAVPRGGGANCSGGGRARARAGGADT
jgi:hypothetical protein